MVGRLTRAGVSRLPQVGSAQQSAARSGTVQPLRDRIREMQETVPLVPVATHPALADLVQLRTGSSYEVDSASLAMMLLSGPSREGAWAAVVGADDFGAEAAAEIGVDLARTVLVPDPGEHWLEVTSALVDVMSIVLLRPPTTVEERLAGRIGARLRKQSTTLLAWGRWPGARARLSLEESTWQGADHGHGRLRSRRITVACRRGTAPPSRVELCLSAGDAPVRSGALPVESVRGAG